MTSKQATIKCKGCDKQHTHPYVNGYNVGKLMDESGMQYIPCQDNRCLWLCQDCFKQTQDLAVKIIEIVKDEWVYFQALIPKEKRKEM